MSNSLNCTNQQTPSYSGVTINITNPALSIPPQYPVSQYQQNARQEMPQQNTQYINRGSYLEPVNNYQLNEKSETTNIYKMTNPSEQQQIPQAYPQQYYINNYNASGAQNPEQNQKSENTQPAQVVYYMPQSNDISQTPASQATQTTGYPSQNQTQYAGQDVNPYTAQNYNSNPYSGVSQQQPKDTNPTKQQSYDSNLQNTANNNDEADVTTSSGIIEELDKKNAEQKELEKSGKKVKIVSLTNEYIMSLENYLNNPNTDIRLMAAKEILTRLDEDKSRYDDAALNALLNKMLQDPEKLIRIAAMSAFSSELASGNDYTVQLLNQIQQNPNADPEDVLEASQILLKRSTSTEIRYTPVQTVQPVQTIQTIQPQQLQEVEEQ